MFASGVVFYMSISFWIESAQLRYLQWAWKMETRRLKRDKNFSEVVECNQELLRAAELIGVALVG